MSIYRVFNLTSNISGILWMVCAAFLLTLSTILLKYLNELYVKQIFLLSSFCSTIWVVVFMLLFKSCKFVKPNKVILYNLLARSVFILIGTNLWYFSIKFINLTTATAISYSTPVFNLFGAIFFLHEKVPWSRIVAIGFAIIGIFIVFSNKIEVINFGYFMAMFAALFWSAGDIITKMNINKTPYLLQCFYLFLFMSLLELPFVMFTDWQKMTIANASKIILLGLLNFLNIFCVYKAYLNADLNIVIPFDFCRIIFTFIFAFIIFGEVTNLMINIGVIIIFISVCFICIQEYYKLK